MFRVIKTYIHVCTITYMILLSGCIINQIAGPGYRVSQSVADNVNLAVSDIGFIDDFAKKEGFDNRRVDSPSGKWECIHYNRELTEPRFQHLKKDKVIFMAYCYDFKGPSKSDHQEIHKLYVDISNKSEGQDPALKGEIDRLAAVLGRELSSRFGGSNIQIDKSRTGQPF